MVLNLIILFPFPLVPIPVPLWLDFNTFRDYRTAKYYEQSLLKLSNTLEQLKFPALLPPHILFSGRNVPRHSFLVTECNVMEINCIKL